MIPAATSHSVRGRALVDVTFGGMHFNVGGFPSLTPQSFPHHHSLSHLANEDAGLAVAFTRRFPPAGASRVSSLHRSDFRRYFAAGNVFLYDVAGWVGMGAKRLGVAADLITTRALGMIQGLVS